MLWWPTIDDLQKCSQFQRSPILECLKIQTLYKVEVGPRRAAGKKPGASGSLLARTKVTNDSRWREGWPLSSGAPRAHSFLQGSRSQSWLHTSVTWGGGARLKECWHLSPLPSDPGGRTAGLGAFRKAPRGMYVAFRIGSHWCSPRLVTEMGNQGSNVGGTLCQA